MISVSLVLVLGIATLLLVKKDGLKVWHAAVAWLFGFYFSETDFAPAVRQGLSKVFGAMFS